jgi:C4-dicarboxylate transporter DctM subunit
VATIASSGVFSAMTGSSFVSASTMGLIAIPELRRARYSDTIISASITAGGSLGSVIPPSIVMIIYGYLTEESIAKLFMAGMVPGILLIILYSAALTVLAGRHVGDGTAPGSMAPQSVANDGNPGTGSADMPENQNSKDNAVPLTHWTALKEAFWGLMAPVIILGGIYLGIFTASEAAAIAAAYCILIGFCVYRNLTLKKLWNILMSAANLSAMVALIVIGGAVLGHAVVFGRVPQEILAFIIDQNFHPLFLLLLINVILFLLGMFLEVLALMYLAIPLLFPVVVHMGWDNIWFAVILMINVNLALITPPMGGVLYIVSQIGGIPIHKVLKGAVLPVSILILVLLMIIFFPPIATWLPSMM